MAEADAGRLACTLERVEDLGHEHFGYCRITDDAVWVIRLAERPCGGARSARRVGLDFDDLAIFAFAADGTRLCCSAESSKGPAEAMNR